MSSIGRSFPDPLPISAPAIGTPQNPKVTDPNNNTADATDPALLKGIMDTLQSTLPVAVYIVGSVGGGIAWQAPVGVSMTGSSKTFVPANASRKALQMWSPAGNRSGAIDIAGGTVTLAASVPISAGASPIYIEGAACPVGIVTAIGTSGQSFYYQEGL